MNIYAICSAFVIAATLVYVVVTLLYWADPDPWTPPRTLVEVIRGQWRFLKELSRRIW